MDETRNCFDAKTAKRIKKNVVGSPHSAFSDAAGNICLLGRGRLAGGGVAFNKAALAWLGEQEGGRFIHAINLTTGLNRLAALDDLPDDHISRRDQFLDRLPAGIGTVVLHLGARRHFGLRNGGLYIAPGHSDTRQAATHLCGAGGGSGLQGVDHGGELRRALGSDFGQ